MMGNTTPRLSTAFWGMMFLIAGILLMSNLGYMMNLIRSHLWDLWPVLLIAESNLIWNA
jgi:hypothetical protein